MNSNSTSYNKTKMEELAVEIDRIKTEYTRIIGELDAKVTEMHTYWNDDSTGGATYQAFKEKFARIQPHLEDGPRYMERFKNSVLDQKDDYRQAENQILGNIN